MPRPTCHMPLAMCARATCVHGVFDVVLATDVCYDIGVLPFVFHTARLLLCRDGILRQGSLFILGHVPRAGIDAEEGAEGGSGSICDAQELMKRTYEAAAVSGFSPHPRVFSADDVAGALDASTRKDMMEGGAQVYIFTVE